jgi:hypothetical protein
VAESACCALNGLVVLDKSSAKMTAIRRQAVEEGAIEALVAALRAHRADASVQWHGWWAVASLYDDDEIAFKNRHALKLASSAIEAVVAALKAHPANAGVQQNGCYALWSMANTLGDKQVAGRCGAVHVVVAALQAHHDHCYVQYHGCEALHSLCDGLPKHAAEARAAGAFQAVVAAMRTNTLLGGDVDVLPNACHALFSMTAGIPANQEQAVADAALPAIVGALKAHPAHECVQRNGCKAIHGIVDGCPASARLAHDIMGPVAAILDAVGASLAACAPQPVSGGSSTTTTVGGGSSGLLRHDAVIGEGHVTVLELLLRRPESADWALRAGATQTLQMALDPHMMMMSTDTVTTAFRGIAAHMQAAAARHDGAPCTHVDCTLCAGARASGALPGCCARKRADDAAKTLLRCGSCRTLCYCCAAHQREDWARHKRECRDLAAAATAKKNSSSAGAGGGGGGGAA